MILSEKQIKLLEMFSKKHQVAINYLIYWVSKGEVTISELALGILGMPVVEEKKKVYNHYAWMK